jgi:2',3'-cyclic-nucleotide 2'-phosphodiesterase (5'-nucleotidase family)
MVEAQEKKAGRESDRRQFLKRSALAGVATAVAGIPAAVATGLPSIEARGGEPQGDGSGRITLLITSDIHAQLHTHDEFFWEQEKPVFRRRGGLAVLKTMVEHYRLQDPESTLLIDGGDFFHGSAVATFTEGEALIPILNAFDYDLILPGNWEVVYKKRKMLYDMGHSNAAKVCANMYHRTTGEENGELIFPPYWVRYIGGVKLGIIGYTDHLTPRRQSPAYSEGIRFEHADKNVARYIRLLREVEGCAVVLLLTHMGLAQQVGLANNPAVAGADFILGADTHERVREPIQGKYSKVVECGAFGSFLGRLELRVEQGRLVDSRYELLDVDPGKYKPDPKVKALVEAAAAPFGKDLGTVIGTSTTPLVRYFVMESPMDNLITDAIHWKLKPDIALSNGFRFCQPLAVDPKTGRADITREFLWNMLPVDSEAKTGYVTGRQLWDWLEQELQNAFAPDPARRFGGWFVRFAGMEVNFTIGNTFGKRVNRVTVKGEPLDFSRSYLIAACEREGDPDDTLCRIEKVASPKRTGLQMHGIIEEYLAGHSPVSPRLEGRSTATDQPPTLLTQLQGTSYAFR